MSNRKRFKEGRLCSSEDYRLSKAVHKSNVLRSHSHFLKSELKKNLDSQKVKLSPHRLVTVYIFKERFPVQVPYYIAQGAGLL